MTNRPKVGVGVIVIKEGKILFQKRMNAHGDGTWSLPGGHLEFNETIEECAKRETAEELGIDITNVRIGPVTNDIFKLENKHYITIFALADHSSGEPQIKEPNKTQEWKWVDWSNLPSPLFLPIQNLIKQGFSPI